MATFKIFESKGSNSVLLNGKFSDYQDYTQLKKKLIDKTSRNPNFKIKDRDIFTLSFSIDKKKNPEIYIPNDLKDGIFNNKTFSHFKEKLDLRGNPKAAYRFIITKLDKLPRWKKKENHEFLKEALDSSWEPINADIISGVSLIKLEESNINYNKMKEELKKSEAKLNKVVHNNIICNNCFKKNFNGKRFICAECNNYNLCQDCEKLFYQKQIHPRDHTLIRVNKAFNSEDENNLNKYNNIIGNNNQEFKNVPLSFQLEISVINIGENDLNNCYILPVRYGEDFLSCSPKVIKEEVQRNMTVKINLVIRVPNNKGYFEGYFRMFTPHGLPFGNVLFVKVLNGD